MAGEQTGGVELPDDDGYWHSLVADYEARETRAAAATAPAGWRDTWRPVDLREVMANGCEPERAEVGYRHDDGQGIFYRGKVNGIAGESESGKSWLALHVASQEIKQGNAVLYIDFEDSPAGIVRRLLAMGCTEQQIADAFDYVRPDGANRLELPPILSALAKSRPYTFAVIDGVTEACSMLGLSGRDENDVAALAAAVLRPVADEGPAVVWIDHVSKSRDPSDPNPLGSQHKRAGVSGVLYLVEPVTPIAGGLKGKTRIRVSKDRPAAIRSASVASTGLQWFGDLVIDATDPNGAIRAAVWAATKDSVDNPRAIVAKAPAHELLRAITDYVSEHAEGHSMKALELMFGGSTPRAKIRDAVNYLIHNGNLVEDKKRQRGHQLVLGAPLQADEGATDDRTI
jgi:hypothetical protein